MPAVADPTVDLLHSLEHEPAKWHVRQGVVAFRAHKRTFPEVKLSDGTTLPGTTVEVTDADLPEIARKANESQRDGTIHPLTIGHRKFDPNFKEHDQPRLVGFVRNYRCETVTRNGSSFKAVVYDEYVPKDQAGIYRQFPYRSAEYNPATGICGVAALLRPPALNLGTVYVYEDGREAYPVGDPAAGDEPLTPEEEAGYPAFVEDVGKYACAAKYMKRYMAAMGPTNASMGEPVSTPSTTPQTYSALPPEVEERIRKLEADRAEAERGRVKAERSRQLDALQGHVKFDYQRELDHLTALSDEQATAHLSYMADYYQPLPVGSMIRTYQGPTAPANLPAPANDPTRPPARYDDILSYMRAHPGMQYDEAAAKVLAQTAQ